MFEQFHAENHVKPCSGGPGHMFDVHVEIQDVQTGLFGVGLGNGDHIGRCVDTGGDGALPGNAFRQDTASASHIQDPFSLQAGFLHNIGKPQGIDIMKGFHSAGFIPPIP